MNKELVSAIITTYKRDVLIVKRAIDSIINQTYKNIEIILVNDFPEKCDNNVKLYELIEDYKKNGINIVYIVVEKNGGACKARNIGINNSTGKYIGFLDDDDEWLPEKVETMLEVFENDNNIAIVYSNSIIYNDANYNTSYFHNNLQPSGNIFKYLFKSNIIGSTSFPMFNKDILLKSGAFNEQMPAMQDLETYLRVCMNHEVVYIPKTLTKYHLYEGERITRNTNKRVEAYERILEEFSGYLANNHEQLYYFYRKGINVYSLNCNIFKAYILHLKSLILKPLFFKNNVSDLFKIIIRIFYRKNVG